MNNQQRVYRLHQILSARRGPVSVGRLEEELECSRATVYRTVGHLRDGLGAPVISVGRGVFYDRSQPRFELPGVWLTADEIQSLLIMDDLIERIEPGVLREQLGPIRSRLQDMLNDASHNRERGFPAERFRILPAHARRVKSSVFNVLAGALVDRRRVHMRYSGRIRGGTSARVVSPQRLARYRDNWYLDAWCHEVDALRTFAVDRIEQPECLDEPALDASEAELDAQLTAGYGIFSGKPRFKARLLFTPQRARWVADEIWHPDQTGQFRTDGTYELTVPYRDSRELIGEILRHGSGVRVLGPKSLVRAVADEAATLAARGTEDGTGTGNSHRRTE